MSSAVEIGICIIVNAIVFLCLWYSKRLGDEVLDKPITYTPFNPAKYDDSVKK